LVGLAPVILVGAAVNAFCEEFLFRNSLIAQVAPVTGKLGALWLTGLRFGIGHWYGNPSGPLGVAGATLLGFLLGKSMLDTRGSGWAWIIHLIGDVMIFALVATAAPAVGQPG
jgi:membrane protease YdiL (CAAX protease family)